MPFDGVFIHFLVQELKDNLVGKRINKIVQPNMLDIVFQFKANSVQKQLLISSSLDMPRIYFTDEKVTSLDIPKNFCVMLRKYIERGIIKDIFKDYPNIKVVDISDTLISDYCKQNNIQVMAYTSTARMDERLRKTCLLDIAQKYNKNMAQIILRWHNQIGNIPIFNSSNEQHVIDNLNISDFELTDEEMKQMRSLNKEKRFFNMSLKDKERIYLGNSQLPQNKF